MQLWQAVGFVKRVYILCFIFELEILLKRVFAFENAVVEECLSDLSISELLRLKHSMKRMEEEGSFGGDLLETQNTAYEEIETPKIKQNDETCRTNCMKPMAMALTGVPRGYLGEHHPWQPQPEEKPSKLTTLFNITITALAFLSFGGYLICLLVHAFKSKGTTFFYPVTTQSTTDVDDGIRRIKIYRRGRRSTKQQQPLKSNYPDFYAMAFKNN